MSQNAHAPTGFLAAWLGSVIGAAVLGLPGAFAGAMLGDATSSGFDEIGTGVTYAFNGLVLGVWVGGSLGCLIALRLRGHQNAQATAAALAALLLVGGLLWAVVLIDMGDLLAIYIPLIGATAAPLVSRALTAPAST